MSDVETGRLATAVLDRYQHRSLAEEADITVGDSPNTLFQLLELGMLASVRIDPGTAADTFRALRERGWTTAKHVEDSEPDERAGLLRELGYREGDATRVARMMGDAAAHLLDEYGAKPGDLRDAAGRDPERIREEVKRFVEVDDHVVDAFFREVQLVWPELRPFADKKALDASSRLGLGEDPEVLREVVDDDEDFVRLVDALARIHHDGAYDDIREHAQSR